MIQTRRHTAAAHKHWAQYWRQVAGWIDDPCLRTLRNPNRPEAYDEICGGQFFDQRRPYIYTLTLDLPENKAQHEFARSHRDEILTLCRERVDYHERMSDRWAFAVWTPWSDPGPDDPVPPIETRVFDQTY